PRFAASRFESIYRKKNILTGARPVQKLAMRQAVTTTSAWLGLAALIKMGVDAGILDDVEFELNPLSSDFLKARFGDTRIDFGAGYGQVFRLIAQTILRRRKNLSSGNIVKVQQLGPISQFVRFKLAPVPSAIASVHKGKTPSQRPATAVEIVKGLTVPISFQNLIEVVMEHGAAGLGLLPFEVHGLGTSVHDFNPDEFKKGDNLNRVYERLWLTVRRGNKEGTKEAARVLKRLGRTIENVKASFKKRKMEGSIPVEIRRAMGP
ncbi:hypothetical protein LCGC14_1327310, partial [marine sediment metagenome]